MDPFVILEPYGILLCSTCQSACLPREVGTHLRSKHRSLPAAHRAVIVRAVARASQGLYQSQADLAARFRLPDRPVPAIAQLEGPFQDGLKCQACPYVARQVFSAQEHCRTAHGWVNPRPRGGDTRPSASQSYDAPPWDAGVWCQRFFRSRAASGWFQVLPPPPPAAALDSSAPPGPTAAAVLTPEEKFLSSVRQAALQLRARTTTVEDQEGKLEPNPWLRRVGWAVHLAGLDTTALQGTASLAVGDGWPIQAQKPARGMMATSAAASSSSADIRLLQLAWESIGRTIQAAQAACAYEATGAAVLFEVNRKTVGEKPHKPFDCRLEPRTIERYANLWKRIVAYLFRTQAWPDDDRPPYRLTLRQQAALAAFRTALLAPARPDPPAKRADRACLDLLVSLLDHPLLNASYDSVLLSALAVVGIREDGGWATPDNYTGHYSAVIKVARMLVVRQAQLEVEEGSGDAAGGGGGSSSGGGGDAKAGLFSVVRAKVRRFTTTVHADGYPTPIDWIFESGSYGLRIRYTTATTGLLYWEGSTVVFRQVTFSVEAFVEMLHCVVGELARTMDALLLLGRDADDPKPKPASPSPPRRPPPPLPLPPPPTLDWSRLCDDASNDAIGYSFLTDPRNDWVAKSEDWVVRRLLADPVAKADWLVERGGDLRFRAAAVAGYLRKASRFRALLLAAVHFLGGQPARTTELLGVRYLNTASGGRRNVFIQHSMVCLAFGYHKGYSRSGQLKVVHRYLPRELGELFVRYLWLVLPFCQQLEALSGTNTAAAAASLAALQPRASPYLWSSAYVVRKSRPQGRKESGDRSEGKDGQSGSEASESGGEEGGEGEGEGQGEGVGQAVRAESAVLVWSSDKMRRVIQDLAVRHLGTKLNISSWRHIAVAISRKYLRGPANGGDDGGPAELATYDDSETDGEDLIPNNAWDLQAGHTSYTAEMIYGREARQGLTGLAARQEQFRQISLAWHRFLGFAAGLGSKGGPGRQGRAEPFDVEGHLVRTRRLAGLSKADLDSLLRQLLGDPQASFRGNQRAAVEAVVRGHSPILQIASTGSGKSLTFLLPSYGAAPGGCTIVVVPFVALQQDLQERCGRLSISCDIWSPREVCTATIVLVTPEALATKQFRDFANRLAARHQLDRVVFDECHTVLDASYDFRPQLRSIGTTLQSLGAQLVFLTATLPPRDEAEFFGTLHLEPEKAFIVRGRTDRPNIAYSVLAVPGSVADEDRASVRLVLEALNGGGGGSENKDDEARAETKARSIVYCQQVRRAERVARQLACPVYHSRAGAGEEKAQVVRQWVDEGGPIVATSALGAGIDIPDVRLVVHVGPPRSLRDFVQESGRAGRDGWPSRSTIVVAQHHCRTAKNSNGSSGNGSARGVPGAGTDVVAAGPLASGVDVAEFVCASSGCRRTILSWVMDGHRERTACQDHEQACDLCARCRPRTAIVGEGGEEGCSGDPARLERGPSLGTWGQALDGLARTAEQARALVRQGGRETDGFVRALEFWAANCVVCRSSARAPEQYLPHRYCHGSKDPDSTGYRQEMWDAVREASRDAKANQYRQGSGAAQGFNGCRFCGVPQQLCGRWQAKDTDGGSFSAVRGRGCSYGDTLFRVVGFAAAAKWVDGEVKGSVFDVVRRCGVWVAENDITMKDFARASVRWDSLEANGLCVLFYILSRDVFDIL